MSSKIKKFYNSIMGNIDKEDLEIELSHASTSIANSLSGLENLAFVFKSDEYKSYTKAFFTNLLIPNTEIVMVRSPDLNVSLKMYMENVIENSKTLSSELKKFGGNKLAIKGLNARQLNIVRSVGLVSFLAEYFFEYLNYFVALETTRAGFKTSQPPKNTTDTVNGKAADFAKLLAVYGLDNNKFKKELDKLTKDYITNDAASDMLDNGASGNDFGSFSDGMDLNPTLSNGFIGNIFFVIGTGLNARRVNKAQVLQDERSLLETRILNLKQAIAEGRGNDQMEKDIEILQDRINVKNRKIESLVGKEYV